MKNKTLHIYHLLMLSALAGFSQTISPTVAPTQGGYVTGGNVRLQYTIGEPVNQTITGGGFEFTLGFQQPEMNLTDTITSSPFCAGSTINIPFTAQGIYGSGNIFTAQLSDSTGNFAGAISIGFDTAIISGTITATIPDSIPAGSNYKIRVISSYPLFTGGPSAIFGIRPMPVFVNDTVQRAVICPGSSTHIYVLSSQAGIQYNLMVNTTLVNAAYGNTDTLAINTGAIDSNTTFYVLATDTATGCSVQLNALNVFTIKIASPNNIAPQAVSSDTAYTFTFANVTTGYGGNQIEWSLDSNFTTSTIDTSPYNIQVKVGPNSDTLIWVRSVNSVSGCVSNAATTIGIVTYVYQLQPFNADTIITICAGTSTNIPIANSNDSLLYTLRVDTNVITSAMGNDSVLLLNTGTVSTNTLFNIFTTNTLTGDTANVGFGILVQTLAPVDTNVLIVGDTLVYYQDTIPYRAIANNGTVAIYSIASGTAYIDSLTGKASGIRGSNFTVQATVYGPAGCGSAMGSKAVTVTITAPPIAPAPVTAYLVNPTDVKIIAFNVTAGSGGDEVEFAFNKNFTGSTIYTSPANIDITFRGIQDTIFWLRTVDSKSGNHSKPVHSSARSSLPTISAGLLDKTNWVYDSIHSEEFNSKDYPAQYIDEMIVPNPIQYQSFINKWNIIFSWDNTAGNANYKDRCNYTNTPNNGPTYPGNTLFDWSDCHFNETTGQCDGPLNGQPTEPDHLISFSNGVCDLSSRQLNTPVTIPDCWGSPPAGGTMYYESGMLMSSYSFPMQYGMWEMRCKFPDPRYGYSAFWNFAWPLNFTITDGSAAPNQTHNGIGWDNGNEGCSFQFYKQTNCNFDEDWHTFTAVTTSTEIVFFVDGKEQWSTLLSETGGPISSSNAAPIIIGNSANNGGYGNIQSDFYIDYFRYYSAANPANAQCFQNINPGWDILNYDQQSVPTGVPATLESLYNGTILPTNQPLPNNNTMQIANSTNGGPSTSIAQTNMVYSANGVQRLYYAGQNNQLYSASSEFLQPSQWYEYALTSAGAMIKDVAAVITSNQNRVYYITPAGEIKFFQWVNNPGQWMNYTTYAYTIPFGATSWPVNLPIDQLGRVWYIGADKNVWVWVPTGPTSGQSQQVTTDKPASLNLNVWDCGCLMFYVNGSNGLVQQTWWNTWSSQGVIASNVSLAQTKKDEQNWRLYFSIGNNFGADPGINSDIYAYNILYGQPNPSGLQKLGNTCGEYDNAYNWPYLSGYSMGSVLGLSPDNNMVYYLASDNNIWYYFNDNDHGTDIDRNIISPAWHRTQLTHSGQIGIFTVQSLTGQLFYVDNFYSVLNTIDWENADNPLQCPNYINDPPHGAIYSMPITGTDSIVTPAVDSVQGLSITVFPNPSQGTFTFNITSGAGGNTDIIIYNINGSPVHQINANFASAGSQNMVWDAGALSSGIYYYIAKTAEGKNFTGKLVKL
jgi:hypothetical protein